VTKKKFPENFVQNDLLISTDTFAFKVHFLVPRYLETKIKLKCRKFRENHCIFMLKKQWWEIGIKFFFSILKVSQIGINPKQTGILANFKNSRR